MFEKYMIKNVDKFRKLSLILRQWFYVYQIVKNSRILETTFSQEQNIKLTFFAVIATKPVDILFEQTINEIKEVNPIYVTM